MPKMLAWPSTLPVSSVPVDDTEWIGASFRLTRMNAASTEMFDVVNERNEVNEDCVCATGDFCDSNMAMQEAFEKAASAPAPVAAPRPSFAPSAFHAPR